MENTPMHTHKLWETEGLGSCEEAEEFRITLDNPDEWHIRQWFHGKRAWWVVHTRLYSLPLSHP